MDMLDLWKCWGMKLGIPRKRCRHVLDYLLHDDY